MTIHFTNDWRRRIFSLVPATFNNKADRRRNVMGSNQAAAVAPVTQSATVADATRRWEIDTAHASAGFKVRHLMVSSVRGHLGPVSGTVFLDESDLSRSRVEVEIDARGIDTREPKRDEHLRSADFLDVAQHPLVRFRSTAVTPGRGDGLAVTGQLTIRGVTRPVTLEVEELTAPTTDPWGNIKRGATARAAINRKDFGLTWNVALEAGGVMVADRIDIEIEVELVARQAPAA
jgi:polyisoprenoid-binding protein YceI